MIGTGSKRCAAALNVATGSNTKLPSGLTRNADAAGARWPAGASAVDPTALSGVNDYRYSGYETTSGQIVLSSAGSFGGCPMPTGSTVISAPGT